MYKLSLSDVGPTTWSDGNDALNYTVEDYNAKNNIVENGMSRYNPTPGGGRTAFTDVSPNNFPFYDEDEKYVPMLQSDGAQLSEWKARYAPTPEEEELDRYRAYEMGVPHGYVPQGDAYKGLPTISLMVISELHQDNEYGEQISEETGGHSGGPCKITVSPKMRVEDVRIAIYKKCGIIPGLQRLMYAGKMLLDDQRTLEHYGVAYWNKMFPLWPLVIARY